jgi:hypothetical protein
MTQGIPIRLSAKLAGEARKAAQVQDRSLTEQVEHWARLGRMVEDLVLNFTVTRLKSLSYDERLPQRLLAVDTASSRRRAAQSIAKKNPVRYGTSPSDPSKITKVEAGRRRTR